MVIKWRKQETVDEGAKTREKWSQELKMLKEQLDNNESLFNMTDDFDVTAYTIHERAALEARYSYLIRLIRAYDEAHSASKQAVFPQEDIVTGLNQ